MSPRPLIATYRTAVALLALVLLVAVMPQPAAEAQPVNQITNGGFDDGLNGWEAFPAPFIDADGFGCIDVAAGAGAYATLIGQNVAMEAGETYELNFTAKLAGGGVPDAIRTVVQLNVDPFTQYLPEQAIAGQLSTTPQAFSFTFTAAEDQDPVLAAIVQQPQDNVEAYVVCVDDVELLGGAEPIAYQPETGPRVRVNQVGYFAEGPKNATVVTDASGPIAWELAGADDEVVASGQTTPEGTDPTAGLAVHTIDFSDVSETGEGFTLTADGETSHPFAIGVADVYDQLRTDALDYYYPTRSGIEITDTDELAPTDIGGDSYSRAAGHLGSALPDGDPDRDPAARPSSETANTGDYDVGCQSIDNQTQGGQPVYDEGFWTCPDAYRLDVIGGWYDAGDHGKYVVNGGISVAQVLSIHERTLTADTEADALADGTLAIPEQDNGVPDVLDEARWQLEFLLRMQVPAGTPDFMVGDQAVDLSGLVHHKVHDEGWTGLPLAPVDDPQVRSLHRPSTAATLNLAAAAAQGARLFEPYDPDFAAELLAAAETAWAAANRVPDLYATAADGQDGGGPYDDDDVTDEFYWAAAELYLTTGASAYLTAVEESPFHLNGAEDPFVSGGFAWGDVAALARMDLATVDSDIPDHDEIVESVVMAAGAYADDQAAQPFGQAYPGDEDGDFVWGSNSAVLNTQIVMATGFDLSGDEQLRAAVAESMDYLLGRNALGWSYLTGYGAEGFTSVNQHSRWWADQLVGSSPNPPPGVISGGPNSTSETWDPVISSLYPAADCPPQQCYVDDIQSWSTNELTINWNAPMAWIASFLADQDELEPTAGPDGSGGEDAVEVIRIEPGDGTNHAELSVAFSMLTDSGTDTWTDTDTETDSTPLRVGAGPDGDGSDVDEVLLASAEVFADALASGPLQGDSPLLLTDPDELPDVVLAELNRLGPATVRILGGVDAVSADVQAAVEAAGFAVERSAGPTRLETAVAVAAEVGDDEVDPLITRAYAGTTDATQAFADALAAGGWAAADAAPVLLTESDRLSTTTADALEDAADTVLIGGTDALTAAVADEVEAVTGAAPGRVAGATRFDTAAAVSIARGFETRAPTTIILIEGQTDTGWAAGFVAARSAALFDAPIVLANGDTLPDATEQVLAGAADREITVICAASEAACDAAVDLLD
ncbi:glycoside hydrolase family 9 protein [Euzebya tangerina]|uniref:glycoside hydrolase family 9 protein n=1 Tax=Euzebya tangerina TaxID=591198 RepID=UPI000E30ED14|nr:glycoside hydrolase family 9 protein [Euzebya tangerina]